MATICPKCKNLNADTAVICINCGHLFKAGIPKQVHVPASYNAPLPSKKVSCPINPKINKPNAPPRQMINMANVNILVVIGKYGKKVLVFLTILAIGKSKSYSGKVIAVNPLRNIRRENISSYGIFSVLGKLVIACCRFFSLIFRTLLMEIILTLIFPKRAQRPESYWERHGDHQHKKLERQIPVFDFRISFTDGSEKNLTLIGDCENAYPAPGDDITAIGRLYRNHFRINTIVNHTTDITLKIRI